MADPLNSTTLVSGVTYGVANQIQQIASGNTSAVNNETRAYNSLFQLTQLTVGSAINRQYNFPAAGLNNGKLVSQTDVLSGETVVYTYDSLNCLATAQTTAGSPTWGQSYTYDGFGNLTDQNVIAGSAPSMHVTYSAATNRQTAPVADTADANGNILGSPYSYLQNIFDLDNRLAAPGNSATIAYSYDAGNKRIWRGDSSAGLDELDFFAGNQKIGTYQISSDSNALYFTLKTTNVYFGGKLVSKGSYSAFGADHLTLAPIAADRLGSIGKFYPYGQERPSATANDTEKFTGYFRDAATGLDYADQRYHQPGNGRFMTPDPFGGSTSVVDPGSWNKYTYAGGDPVNGTDPRGLQTCFFVNGEPQGCAPDLPTVFFGGDTSLPNLTAFPTGPFDYWQSIAAGVISYWQQVTTGVMASGSTTRIAQSVLQDTLGNLADSCQQSLSGSGITVDTLSTHANDLRFYDAGGLEGGLSLNLLSGSLGGSQPTVASFASAFFSQNPGSVAFTLAVTPAGGGGATLTNSVVLAPGFLNLSPLLSSLVLIHEDMHSAYNLNDADLAKKLNGGNAIPDGTDPSQFISDWLQQKCGVNAP